MISLFFLDAPLLLNGEQKIRSYVFLSKKNQERKTPTYSYKYFIIQKDVFKLKNILLQMQESLIP